MKTIQVNINNIDTLCTHKYKKRLIFILTIKAQILKFASTLFVFVSALTNKYYF